MARAVRFAAALFVAALAPIISAGHPAPAAGAAAQGGPERRVTIFYTAEIHGTPEPCGCTSDPLGDVARYAELVRGAARSTPVLLVDAGGLSFPESATSKERLPNEERATFLGETLGRIGPPFAAGLAETDFAPGSRVVPPARLAVNLAPPAGGTLAKSAELAPSVVKVLGGVRVGVLGVADPALGSRLGVKAEDPVTAAKREAARLRGSGVELVIALAPIDRLIARRLAREAAVDLVVLGRQVGKGQERAERVGNAYLVAPADELQRAGRIDIVWRGRGPLVDAGGPEVTALRRVEIDKAISRLDEELKAWAAARGGDPAFIAAKTAERDALRAERKTLDAPWKPPEGSYFTNRLIPIRRSLPRDPRIAADMRRLDRQIAAINLRTAAPPPPPEPGRPYFVGDAKCAGCHKAALAFWKKTVHAAAWRTLVEGGKQNDYKCVSCHVTGYGQVGGSSLGHTDRLRDVQCEVCHGPGSAHVAAEGLEEPLALSRETPASTCTACHTEQHSDTFQYDAYLRDVLGPGHGPTARKKLGDGPSGHTLRSAALTRAKQAGRAQVGEITTPARP